MNGYKKKIKILLAKTNTKNVNRSLLNINRIYKNLCRTNHPNSPTLYFLSDIGNWKKTNDLIAEAGILFHPKCPLIF